MTGKCGQVAEGRQLGPKLQNDPGMDFGTTAKAIDRYLGRGPYTGMYRLVCIYEYLHLVHG